TRSLNPRVSSESFIYQLIRLAGIRDYCRPPGRANDSPGRPVSFMVLAASVQWQRQPRLASGRIRVGSLPHADAGTSILAKSGNRLGNLALQFTTNQYAFFKNCINLQEIQHPESGYPRTKQD